MGKLLLSMLTCAVSFPAKLFDRSEWPTISNEGAEQLGGWIHRQNSYWVTTLRYNANFFAKAFAFEHVAVLAVLILTMVF